MTASYATVLGEAGSMLGAISQETQRGIRRAERVEAARELRAAGFRTGIRQTAAGTRFSAVRRIGPARVVVTDLPSGRAVVGAVNDATVQARGRFTSDLTEAACLGLQYADVISR